MATNPIKARPAATLGALFTALMGVLTYLSSHGVVSQSFVKDYGVFIVVGVCALAFLLVWFHVVPYAKVQEMETALADGRLPDADLARVEVIVTDAVKDHLLHAGISPLSATAIVDGTSPPPAGMSAGAPTT